MATKQKDEEPPAPTNEEELKLNLTFCSTEDLAAEILRRGNPGIVIYTKTDLRDEDKTSEFHDLNGGEGRTATSYKSSGMYSTVLGMLEIVKASLLRDYFE